MVFPIVGGTQSTGYEIDNSLRIGGGDNHHLSMVYGSSASNRKTFTFSSWIKLGQAAHFTEYYANEKYLFTSTDRVTSTTNVGYGGYTSANAGGFHFQDGRSGTYIETTSKFRDPSAWYHVVVRYDSTQSTASDRIFIYVNGVSQSLNYSNTGDPEVDLNTEVDFFLAGDDIDATSADSGNFVHNVNGYYNSSSSTTANHSFDGHFADMYLINAQSLAPTEFGETNDNGVWVPKKYTGTFNAHSFHLEFEQTGSSANSSGIGADTSGQDNHFKVGVNSTLAAVDVTTDTPTNNFAIVNPITETQGVIDFSEGNTQIAGNTTTQGSARSSIQIPPSGKWYIESEFDAIGGSGSNAFGIVTESYTSHSIDASGGRGVKASYSGGASSRVIQIMNGSSQIGSNINVSSGIIMQLAVDQDNGKAWLGKDDTYYNSSGGTDGNPANGSNPTFTFTAENFDVLFGAYKGGGGDAIQRQKVNFGNPPFAISSGNADANGYGNFEYAVPSGYYSLCTKNLAEFG